MPPGLDAEALLAPLQPCTAAGLAVSGGADSLGLMLLAKAYAKAHPAMRFFVYTVDHGLRPEAAAETAFVLREAERLGFPGRVLRWEGEKPGTGIQEAARRARYRLIGEAMRADGAQVLLTGHHLHDQAETVLMRLAHGSGLEGLRGMDAVARVEGVTILRPLLGTDPAALRALVAAAGLAPVADPSNSDVAYERVRWRQILPQLAALGLDAKRLGAFAARARDADAALAAAAAAASATLVRDGAGGSVAVSRPEFDALPRAIAVRVLGGALERVGAGGAYPLSPVERLVDRLRAGQVRTTLHGCLVRSTRELIRIAPEPLSGARARRRTAAVEPSGT